MKKFDLSAVAARRKQLGLTLGAMAERLGQSGGSVYYKYEKGIYKFNAEDIPRLAAALECSAEDLFTQDFSAMEFSKIESSIAEHTERTAATVAMG